MKDRMPFGAVAGDADIEELGDGAVYRVDCQRIKDIVAGTHKNGLLWRGGCLTVPLRYLVNSIKMSNKNKVTDNIYKNIF